MDHHVIRECEVHVHPRGITHLVIGGINIQRMGNTNILEHEQHKQTVSGLVFIHIPGGMDRFSGLVKPVIRLLHSMFNDSFEDGLTKVDGEFEERVELVDRKGSASQQEVQARMVGDL